MKRSVYSSIILLFVMAAIANAQTSVSAISYFNRGNEKFAKGDAKGAIKDYDLAIIFAPNLLRLMSIAAMCATIKATLRRPFRATARQLKLIRS